MTKKVTVVPIVVSKDPGIELRGRPWRLTPDEAEALAAELTDAAATVRRLACPCCVKEAL